MVSFVNRQAKCIYIYNGSSSDSNNYKFFSEIIFFMIHVLEINDIWMNEWIKTTMRLLIECDCWKINQYSAIMKEWKRHNWNGGNFTRICDYQLCFIISYKPQTVVHLLVFQFYLIPNFYLGWSNRTCNTFFYSSFLFFF